MRGQILGVDDNSAVMIGAEDQRLEFPLSEWRSNGRPEVGQWVDFVLHEGRPVSVYALPTQAPGRAATPSPAGPQPTSSFVLGAVGVGCLVVGLVIPVIPTLAALIFGLLGAGKAREENDASALLLSRIAWIGAVVLIGLGVIALAVALMFLSGAAHWFWAGGGLPLWRM